MQPVTAGKTQRNMNWLVGLHGVPGAGKDTAADFMDAVKLSFSTKIYAEVSEVFGVTVEFLQDRQRKDDPYSLQVASASPEMVQVLEMAGYARDGRVSNRAALQEWGDYRRRQDRHYWTNIIKEQAKSLLDQGFSVVIADVRKLEELWVVEALGGVMATIENPRAQARLRRLKQDGDPAANHALENELSQFVMPYTICNDASKGALIRNVVAFEWMISQAMIAGHETPKAILKTH